MKLKSSGRFSFAVFLVTILNMIKDGSHSWKFLTQNSTANLLPNIESVRFMETPRCSSNSFSYIKLQNYIEDTSSCDYLTEDICEIHGNRFGVLNLNIYFKGSIVFKNVNISCMMSPKSYNNSQISVLGRDIKILNGSLIHCPSIMLQSENNIYIDQTSQISTNSSSYYTNTINTVNLDQEPIDSEEDDKKVKIDELQSDYRGGSYGGIGGQLSEFCSEFPKHSVYGDHSQPYHFGEAGVGKSGRGMRGGGRIYMEAYSVVIEGTASSCGENGSNKRPAGSGGSIYIECESFIGNNPNPEYTLLAIGGFCPSSETHCVCGSGGRVALISKQRINQNFAKAYGGFNAKLSSHGCSCGGAGTIFISPPEKLIIDNTPDFSSGFQSSKDSLISSSMFQPTPIKDIDNKDLILEIFTATVIPYDNNKASSSSLNLAELSLQADFTGSIIRAYDLTIITHLGGVRLTQQSTIKSNRLKISTFTSFDLGSSASLEVEKSEIHSRHNMNIMGTIYQKGNHQIDRVKLHGSTIKIGGSIVAQAVSLHARKISLLTGSTVRSSSHGRCDVLPIENHSVCSSHINNLLKQIGNLTTFDTKTEIVSKATNKDKTMDTSSIGPSKNLDESIYEKSRSLLTPLFNKFKSFLSTILPKKGLNEIHNPFEGSTDFISNTTQFVKSIFYWNRKLEIELPIESKKKFEPYQTEQENELINDPPYELDFDLELIALQLINIEVLSQINFPTILVCSQDIIQVDGKISASMLGCPPDEGIGSGHLAVLDNELSFCGAGGGGHAGAGGNGVDATIGKTCYDTGGSSYDSWKTNSNLLPTTSASGGGGDSKFAGRGGGISWIGANLLVVNGEISCDGGSAEPMSQMLESNNMSHESIEVNFEKRYNNTKPLEKTIDQEYIWEIQDSIKNQFLELSLISRYLSIKNIMKLWAYTILEDNNTFIDPISHTLRKVTGDVNTPRIKQWIIDSYFYDMINPQYSYLMNYKTKFPTIGTLDFPHYKDIEVINRPCKLEKTIPIGLTHQDNAFTKDKEARNYKITDRLFSKDNPIGQGGGAGGTLIIEVSSLNGNGNISASGGHGGLCTGGGGGGGVLGFNWKQPSFDGAKSFNGTIRVQGGNSDPSKECQNNITSIFLGHPGDHGKLVSFQSCAPGHTSWNCIPCPIGTYNEDGGEICHPCKNKPNEDSFYTHQRITTPDCPYACPDGYTDVAYNPLCLSPYLYFLSTFAHFLSTWPIISILLITLIFFLLKYTAQKKFQPKQTWEDFYEPHPLYKSRLDNQLLSALLSGEDTYTFNDSHYGLDYSNRKVSMSNALLRLEDIPFHSQRIYLSGDNSIQSPWSIDTNPPPNLMNFLIPENYKTFAKKVNKICQYSRWTRILDRLLVFFFSPLAHYIRIKYRLQSAIKIFKLVKSLETNQSIGFWKSIRAREITQGIKFGCDSNATLGYLDILNFENSLMGWTTFPKLPQLIPLSGNGSFYSPFHIDLSDPFAYSLSQFLGNSTWILAIDCLNRALRCLDVNFVPTSFKLQMKRFNNTLKSINRGLLHPHELELNIAIYMGEKNNLLSENEYFYIKKDFLNSPKTEDKSSLKSPNSYNGSSQTDQILQNEEYKHLINREVSGCLILLRMKPYSSYDYHDPHNIFIFTHNPKLLINHHREYLGYINQDHDKNGLDESQALRIINNMSKYPLDTISMDIKPNINSYWRVQGELFRHSLSFPLLTQNFIFDYDLDGNMNSPNEIIKKSFKQPNLTDYPKDSVSMYSDMMPLTSPYNFLPISPKKIFDTLVYLHQAPIRLLLSNSYTTLDRNFCLIMVILFATLDTIVCFVQFVQYLNLSRWMFWTVILIPPFTDITRIFSMVTWMIFSVNLFGRICAELTFLSTISTLIGGILRFLSCSYRCTTTLLILEHAFSLLLKAILCLSINNYIYHIEARNTDNSNVNRELFIKEVLTSSSSSHFPDFIRNYF